MMNWQRTLLLKDRKFREAVEKVWGKEFLRKALEQANKPEPKGEQR